MALETISSADFDRFRRLLYEHSGIHLADNKQPLLIGRLGRRLRELGLDSYADYYQRVTQPGCEVERQRIIDLLTTNETYFFREPKHFDFLRQHVLPKAAPGKLFRVWSAASSSGEEPYSLAMTLAESLGTTPWEIVGSDISSQVLAKARTGHYAMERTETLPRPLLTKYCLKGIGRQEGTFLIDKALRDRVNFVQVNLNEALPALGEFEVIFLRNVMIYFDSDTKVQVVKRLINHLKPGGYFLVSHSESLNGVTDQLRVVKPSIYRRPHA